MSSTLTRFTARTLYEESRAAVGNSTRNFAFVSSSAWPLQAMMNEKIETNPRVFMRVLIVHFPPVECKFRSQLSIRILGRQVVSCLRKCQRFGVTLKFYSCAAQMA